MVITNRLVWLAALQTLLRPPFSETTTGPLLVVAISPNSAGPTSFYGYNAGTRGDTSTLRTSTAFRPNKFSRARITTAPLRFIGETHLCLPPFWIPVVSLLSVLRTTRADVIREKHNVVATGSTTSTRTGTA